MVDNLNVEGNQVENAPSASSPVNDDGNGSLENNLSGAAPEPGPGDDLNIRLTKAEEQLRRMQSEKDRAESELRKLQREGMTREERMQADLEEAKARAEQADLAASQFYWKARRLELLEESDLPKNLRSLVPLLGDEIEMQAAIQKVSEEWQKLSASQGQTPPFVPSGAPPIQVGEDYESLLEQAVNSGNIADVIRMKLKRQKG